MRFLLRKWMIIFLDLAVVSYLVTSLMSWLLYICAH